MDSRPGRNIARRRRLRAALLTGAVAAVPLYLSMGPAQSLTGTVTKFAPAADTFVDQSQAGTNFGGRAALRTDPSPVTRSYIRFNVANLNGAVTRATLRILPKASSAAGVAVHGVAGAWGEKTVTFATAPAPGPAVASSGGLTAGTWTAVDVTALVPGNGAVNLALTAAAGPAVGYPSREASSGRAQLVVETDGGTTTTTTTTAPPSTTTTTTAPSSGGTLPTGCSARLTARQATANVLGYLYGDGHFGSGGYNYTARSSCKLTRVKTDLQTIGARYTLSSNKFTIAPVYPFDKGQDQGASPWMATASADEIKAFLAGVIEGEGSGSGKVFDDPSWNRTTSLVDLYRRINVVVKPDHAPPPAGSYWNTFVDPSAPKTVYNGYIAIIRSFPFAEWGRVPNYR